MTKVLLLGLGRWGVNHLRNLNSLPVELYVAEPDAPRLEPARRVGLPEARLTTNHCEFLAKVDCAVVATPAPTHFSLGRELLEAGKDVFVEKPLALVPDEARGLAELADERKLILQVGHIFRHDPATIWLRDKIRAGEFGRVNLLRGRFAGFKRPRADSGIMFADGIHFVDLFNYLLGALPKSVMAFHHDFLERGLEDTSLLSLEYETAVGRTWATVENDYFMPGKYREVVLVGDRLSAVCDYNAAQYKIKTHENRHERDGGGFKSTEGAVHQVECAPEEPLLAELRAFVDSVQTRKPPPADGWAGHDAVRVLAAAMESAKTGKAVGIGG